MITLQNLTIGYKSRILLSDADTKFPKASLTSLIGRNGTGKSTLLRAIAGLNPHYSGSILLDGKELSSLSPSAMAKTLAFVSTQRTRIPSMRSVDAVAMGRAPYTNWIGRMQKVDEEIVMRSLSEVGMEAFAQRTLDTMSDGECQRVMIARALAQDTPIILLDEPTSFLDMPSRYDLVTLLNRLAHDQEKCILFSTHELDIATEMCDAVALIDTPRLIHLPAQEFIAAGHLSLIMERRFPNRRTQP
ncbi:MAG: ABC transporter ATP-binding protein [Muribaculaceae bacterium]|nr:ABC transporter ATP-binding protein [Muribaculaceae bacterium]